MKEWLGKVKSSCSMSRMASAKLSTLLVLAVILLSACLYACNSPSTQTPSPKSQEKPTVSLSQPKPIETHPDIGFASRQRLVEHYQKHGREFGSISMEEYLRQAQELRDRPAGENVLEAVRPDGVISRFDRRTGDFIAFNPDGVIRTYFRPNEGETYFWRQSRRGK